MKFLLCLIGCAAVGACPLPAQTTGISSSFFAITTLDSKDYPPLPMGTIGHATLAWTKIEGIQKRQFNFSYFDAYLADAKAHGLVDSNNVANVFVVFGQTPQWAASDTSNCKAEGGSTQCPSPPSNIQDWADFITAVIGHYNGVTQPHIRYYELWNEANGGIGSWTGTYAQMVQLAQAAHPIIHTDPYSQLLTPSVVGSVLSTDPNNAATWITGYLQAGGAQYADGGTYHGYIGRKGVMPFPMPEQDSTSGCTAQNLCYGSIVTYANKIRQAFDANGLLGKPMFQTEGGWGDANVTDSDTQIAWIARFYLLQAGLSVTDSLQLASWYAWGQTASNTWGVIETIDGSKQATAAGNAYAQVYNWLEGATISQPCASLPNSTWTCTLTRPGNYAALAAWSVSGDVQFTPASSYTSCRDLDSGVSCGGWLPRQPITLGIKPVLFEGTQPAATLRRHPRRLPRP